VDIFRKADKDVPNGPDTPKRRPRRKFSDEFKEHAARLVLDDGKSMAVVARELDLVPTALREGPEFRERLRQTHRQRLADRQD
jgi:transposase-like protein